MQVVTMKPGRTVKCGNKIGHFLRMCGADALIELTDGQRVMWSGSTEVEVLSDEEEVATNIIPKLEAELARLETFTRGKYAELGITVTTSCIELPKSLHAPFIEGLGIHPVDAILCRRCSTKLCIRYDHLFFGTRSDCQRDMVLRGVAKPSGKLVSVVGIAAKLVKIRIKLARLRVVK